MNAHDLIDSIFRRPHNRDLPGDQRRITRSQLDFLFDLIGEDDEGGAVEPGRGKSLVWMPRGRWKYALHEDPAGKNHTLAKLGNLRPSDTGRLF